MNKIYVFKTDIPYTSDEMGWACDEDGVTLSSHYCSEGWANKDMFRAQHAYRYSRRYPDGYTADWVGSAPSNWDRARGYVK